MKKTKVFFYQYIHFNSYTINHNSSISYIYANNYRMKYENLPKNISGSITSKIKNLGVRKLIRLGDCCSLGDIPYAARLCIII